MKFKFRLQKIADFYRDKEALKKLELADLVGRVNEIKKQMEQFAKENTLGLEKTNQVQEVSTAWLLYSSERIKNNLQSIAVLNERFDELQKFLEQKKMELSEVARRNRAIEKFREKRLLDFRLWKGRKEQLALDEVNQMLRVISE